MKFALFLCFISTAALADVKLPPIISAHMVLAKAEKVPIWGTAGPGEEITITLDKQTAKATAGPDGKWKMELNLKDSAPGPFVMTVQGKNKITIPDVVVGAVWLASGQSNMAFPLVRGVNAQKEIADSTNPLLRFFTVRFSAVAKPAEECGGQWLVSSPQVSQGFFAVAYHFGKKLQSELNIPVGMIDSAVGGTFSEAWTSDTALDKDPETKVFKDVLQKRLTNYPVDRERFVKDFEAWQKANGREDRPISDVKAFASDPLPAEGWTPVNLPGAVTGPGLPARGAIWLRRDVEIPENAVPKKQTVSLGALTGFDSVYWNSVLVGQRTVQTYPGNGSMSNYTVPPELVKPGKNTLAIRVFAPVNPVIFSVAPAAMGQALKGEWLAHAEFSFPDSANLSPAPAAPVIPPPAAGTPAFLFNGMIYPLIPYALDGIIWYQGENNESRAYQYRVAFPLMIEDWRARWGRGDIPFYFCQIANYRAKNPEPSNEVLPVLWESQSLALRLPNTGEAIIDDLGEAENLHPINKKDVGERLALIALANSYGKKIPFSGPTYESMTIEKGAIRVKFAHTDGGLIAKPLPATYDLDKTKGATAPLVRNSPNSQVEGFAICGEDHKWVWADASIDGDSVLVWSPQIPNPVAVRYAWANNPTDNLTNATGIPATPFRTDDFPVITQPVKK